MARPTPPPLYIVSGATGACGEQLVQTVLAQFPDHDLTVVTVPHVRRKQQLKAIVQQAKTSGGTIVHTFVDQHLRDTLTELAHAKDVPAIDLLGDLITRLGAVLGRQPLGQPGRYRELNQPYFDRVEAIEFALYHDDGLNPQDLDLAEIVLTGVSRVGKSPLSMYLAIQGWKTANVPLVKDQPPPAELLLIDRNRVFGLTIDPDTMQAHREQRRRKIGALHTVHYSDLNAIFEELEYAHAICKKNGFTTLDVTDKPIESSADEIVQTITRRFPTDAHKH